jgi:hypothetical protein
MSKTFRKAPLKQARKADNGMNELKKQSRTKAAAKMNREVLEALSY